MGPLWRTRTDSLFLRSLESPVIMLTISPCPRSSFVGSFASRASVPPSQSAPIIQSRNRVVFSIQFKREKRSCEQCPALAVAARRNYQARGHCCCVSVSLCLVFVSVCVCVCTPAFLSFFLALLLLLLLVLLFALATRV